MALSVDALASVLKNAVYNLELSENAMDKMGEALASYIKENTELKFSWSNAFNSQGVEDSLKVADGEITTLDAFDLRFDNDSYDTQSSALQKFAQNLQSSLAKGKFNITQSGFSTSEASIASDATTPTIQIQIGDIDDSSDIQEQAFKQLSNCIINWIKSLSLSATCSGSHSDYVGGIGTVTSIS